MIFILNLFVIYDFDSIIGAILGFARDQSVSQGIVFVFHTVQCRYPLEGILVLREAVKTWMEAVIVNFEHRNRRQWRPITMKWGITSFYW